MREGFVGVAIGKENVFKFKLHVTLVVDPVEIDGMRCVYKFDGGKIEFAGINRIENFYGESRVVAGVLKADDVLQPGK